MRGDAPRDGTAAQSRPRPPRGRPPPSKNIRKSSTLRPGGFFVCTSVVFHVVSAASGPSRGSIIGQRMSKHQEMDAEGKEERSRSPVPSSLIPLRTKFTAIVGLLSLSFFVWFWWLCKLAVLVCSLGRQQVDNVCVCVCVCAGSRCPRQVILLLVIHFLFCS